MNVPSSTSLDDHDQAIQPLGTRSEIVKAFAPFNTAPDTPNGDFLYGPGMTVQMPPSADGEINQLLVGVNEEDMAWPVLTRACKANRWQLLDPDSGRSISFG